ncbi:MAG TPA: nitroreductase family deazaflavin-dependent oxidoreductase [Candidatus Saccharimonadales bacterium]|jgi:deazaflavin-dependent oxidoreductase (nitroreductase family)|nr:nitroreductase family deazaflavin-dependent oxidoreductase [Candidatus Saccharimonadales bacterium]
MRSLRAVTARVLNPFTRLIAGRLPLFGIVTHVGRRSGRTYRTPLNVFREADHYYVALTYGSDVDWVKNVLAAQRCQLRTRGRDVELVEPEIISDRELRFIPFPGRVIERWNGVTRVVRMRRVNAPETRGSTRSTGGLPGTTL